MADKIRKRYKGSIYRKLVGSYVVFSLLVILVFVLTLLAVTMTVSRGDPISLSPFYVTDRESFERSLTGVTNIGGWIEELDEEYRVTGVHGEKKTKSYSYTPRELFRLTQGGEGEQTYVGFLNERTDASGYYFVLFNRKDMRLTTTVLYGPENTVQGWNKMFLILFFGLFAGMCLLMGYYLSRRIRRPLLILMEGMERMRGGEEGVRLDFQAEAEFADIRDTFNLMSSSLERARREKAEAERKRDRMLLELSHDIRTPIATINSYAVALEQDVVRGQDLKKYYGIIRSKAGRVNLLAEDMFTMLKMQSSGYELNKTRGDVCEFLRRECAEYYEDAREKGLEMSVSIPEQPILLEADFLLLKRVMGNLLSNGIRYNKTGRVLEITLCENESPQTNETQRTKGSLPADETQQVKGFRSAEETQRTKGSRSADKAQQVNGFQSAHDEKARLLAIQVADDGEPVSADIREHIFDDFIRGDSARSSSGGTGLGLSIAKAIVEKHGGNIAYCYENKRNRFTVTLRYFP